MYQFVLKSNDKKNLQMINFPKKRIFSVIFSFLLILQILLLNILPVYAATSPWNQTDWAGGGGQTSWSDTTKFDSSSNVSTSTAGQIKLSNTEKLANTGFETDLASWNTTQEYNLNDQFTTARSAGSVNGTAAEPTGGTRTVTDANSKLSITGGQLSVATGGVGAGNPGLWYGSTTRTAGRSIVGTLNLTSQTGGNGPSFGFDSNQSGGIAYGLFLNSTIIVAQPSGTIGLGSMSLSTDYKFAVVLRATGNFIFVKGGEYANWTLLYIVPTGNEASVFPGISTTAASPVFTADNVGIPSSLYIPVPLVSDGFSSSTTDGSGNAENNGPVGTAWTGSTWTVAGGSVSNSPTLGSELLTNGNMETGDPPTGVSTGSSTIDGVADERTGGAGVQSLSVLSNGIGCCGRAQFVPTTIPDAWYSGSGYLRTVTGATVRLQAYRGVAPFETLGRSANISSASWSTAQYTFRARTATTGIQAAITASGAGHEFRVDDYSVKPLTLSSLFRSVNAGSADVLAESAVTGPDNNVNAGQAGLVLNLDSAASPANFILVYLDGMGSLIVDEAVAGVYTNKQTTSVTYSAGAVLRAIRDGTKLRVYYNNALVGSELTMTANTNTLHGLFSTSTTSTFDNFAVWPRSGYSDAPFDDLTVTRDTATTYNGSAGSAKLVATTDNTFTQPVNVGDTNTYNFSAYAYTNGSAVTSSDLGLYANGSAVTTTYTAVGSGWYQLTGTVTGTASSVGYGVKVKAGKTVYVDNFSLNNYASSGTLTSSIFDVGPQGGAWGMLSYSATTPSNTSVTVKARSSNDSGMSGTAAFSTCTAITSGTDISSNNCITDNNRYIQYQLTLANTSLLVTPTFADITINFEGFDTVGPVLNLDSPGDNSYTNNERPTFKWKQATDALSGISDYDLIIDNPSTVSAQASGDFTISDIPLSRTTDYETNKYIVHYDGFSDSDSTNNYISVYTKSSPDWGTSENDGKLREGKVSWRVKATDGASNETNSSRTLFVDRTNPYVEFTQINESVVSGSGMTTTDRTPTIQGNKTDPLAGADNGQTIQDENGPQVASGPKYVDIKVEKKEGLIYKLISLYRINMDEPYYTCESGKTIDNSKQKCDKYLPFSFTPEAPLDLGSYKITLSGKDNADNSSGETTLTLNITSFSKITTPEEKKIIDEETKTLTPDEQKEIQEKLEITKPTEEVPVSMLEKAGRNINQTTSALVSGAKGLITTMLISVRDSLAFALKVTNDSFAFVFNIRDQALAFIFDKTMDGFAFAWGNFESDINNRFQAFLSGINLIAQYAPGFTKNIILALGNGVNVAGNFAGNTANNIVAGIYNTGQVIAQGFNNGVNGTREGIANLAFGVGEKTQGVSDTVGFAFVKFGYLFVNEPTKIYDVKVAAISPTSAKVSWQTNHPATGKVNYGLDETYPFDVQTDKRTTYHEFTLTNLSPGTGYHFEVMSQNKNYVYDANRKFTTPADNK